MQEQMKYILCRTHTSISCIGFRIFEQELLCLAYIYEPVYAAVNITLNTLEDYWTLI